MIGHLVVELVTPAMIGGAMARQCDDPPTLRPPSLRGHLRFWSRALADRDLEHALWGEEKLGQRVRILSATTLRSRGQKVDLKDVERAKLLPETQQRKATRLDMIPPGDQVVLRFGIPDGISLPHLQAVLWTWLHLGTVGRRSRRGYGSLQWRPSEGDLLAGWPPLWPSHHLKSRPALERYLEEGLLQVASICHRPDRTARQATDGLITLDQVFVGKELPGEWEASKGPAGGGGGESLESIVHGLNSKGRGGEPDRSQLGSADPRWPSPMMWRLFPVAGKAAFLPVMTWFPTGYPPSGPVFLDRSEGTFKYLNGELGFDQSLAGNDLAM